MMPEPTDDELLEMARRDLQMAIDQAPHMRLTPRRWLVRYSGLLGRDRLVGSDPLKIQFITIARAMRALMNGRPI